MKTLTFKNIHLANFIKIISIQRNPQTNKKYAVILLNLYGNITPVNVPEPIIPFFKKLKSHDNLLVYLKTTPQKELFLYGVEKLGKEIYN